MSVVTNGLPVPPARITIAALLQVADRPAADVRLGDRLHPDGGHAAASRTFIASSVSCKARPFMTVASMPM